MLGSTKEHTCRHCECQFSNLWVHRGVCCKCEPIARESGNFPYPYPYIKHQLPSAIIDYFLLWKVFVLTSSINYLVLSLIISFYGRYLSVRQASIPMFLPSFREGMQSGLGLALGLGFQHARLPSNPQLLTADC